jgi:hypothetical protein
MCVYSFAVYIYSTQLMLLDRQRTAGTPFALMTPSLIEHLAAKLQTPYNGSKAGITVSVGPMSEGC